MIVSDFKSLIFYKYVNEELPPRGAGEPEYYDALYAEYLGDIQVGGN